MEYDLKLRAFCRSLEPAECERQRNGNNVVEPLQRTKSGTISLQRNLRAGRLHLRSIAEFPLALHVPTHLLGSAAADTKPEPAACLCGLVEPRSAVCNRHKLSGSEHDGHYCCREYPVA